MTPAIRKPLLIKLINLICFNLLVSFTGCAKTTAERTIQYISSWDELTNPVFESDNGQITGVDAIYERGTWFLFYSSIYEDSTGTRSRIVEVSTRDFKVYSEPILFFNGSEDGWRGMANPAVTKLRNIYYLTFNAWGDLPEKPNQLFYMTSRDLKNWTIKTPLAPELTSQEKATHPTLAFSRGKWFLLYNHANEPRMAMASGIRFPFERLGMGKPVFYTSTDTTITHRTHRLINFGSKWGVLASGNNIIPYLYKLSAYGKSGLSWLNWDGGYPVQVIRREIALAPAPVSASLVNMKRAGGYFYLFYVMHPVGETSQQASKSSIEVYRSTDLVYWAPAGR